jgi:hypothetical protein
MNLKNMTTGQSITLSAVSDKFPSHIKQAAKDYDLQITHPAPHTYVLQTEHDASVGLFGQEIAVFDTNANKATFHKKAFQKELDLTDPDEKAQLTDISKLVSDIAHILNIPQLAIAMTESNPVKHWQDVIKNSNEHIKELQESIKHAQEMLKNAQNPKPKKETP